VSPLEAIGFGKSTSTCSLSDSKRAAPERSANPRRYVRYHSRRILKRLDSVAVVFADDEAPLDQCLADPSGGEKGSVGASRRERVATPLVRRDPL
jgi:hypothetical protein